MKRYIPFFLSVVLIFFVVAATVPVDSIVPAVAITLLTAVVIPILVELVKALAAKSGKDWLTGKAAASIYGWVLALIAVVIYFDWEALPAPPSEPLEWIKWAVLYGSLIAKAAEFVYNAIIAKIFDGLAEKNPEGLFGYKLK